VVLGRINSDSKSFGGVEVGPTWGGVHLSAADSNNVYLASEGK